MKKQPFRASVTLKESAEGKCSLLLSALQNSSTSPELHCLWFDLHPTGDDTFSSRLGITENANRDWNQNRGTCCSTVFTYSHKVLVDSTATKRFITRFLIFILRMILLIRPEWGLHCVVFWERKTSTEWFDRECKLWDENRVSRMRSSRVHDLARPLRSEMPLPVHSTPPSARLLPILFFLLSFVEIIFKEIPALIEWSIILNFKN